MMKRTPGQSQTLPAPKQDHLYELGRWNFGYVYTGIYNTRLPFGGGYVTISQANKAIHNTLDTYYEKKLSHVQVKTRPNPTAHEERYAYLVIFRCSRG